MFFIYLIKNVVNDNLYIGKTNDVEHRWSQHKVVATGGRNKYPKQYHYLHSAIAKYGIDKFELSTLAEVQNEKESFITEKNYIARFKREGYKLYNLTEGGEGLVGWKHSKEAKQKVSAARLGKNRSEETKRKISLSMSGASNHKAKLSWTEVNLIRELLTQNVLQEKLAIQFNVSSQTISDICRRNTWKD